MTAHVASVLRRGVTRNRHGVDMDNCLCAGCLAETTRLLNLLAAEKYAVVKLPEGVTVAHGARLVEFGDIEADGDSLPLYVIEATP